MKLKIKYFCVFLLLLSCGQEKSTEVVQSKLVLDLELPSSLLSTNVVKKKEDITYYKFYFSGNFNTIDPVEIPRLQFSQYVFPHIPFDDHLNIKVEAFCNKGAFNDKDVLCCHAEVIVQYNEGEKDTVRIPLQCN